MSRTATSTLSARRPGGATGPAAPTAVTAASGDLPRRRRGPQRCSWCGRQLPDQLGVGRRRLYCGQSCRQRAYENRTALQRSDLPDDAVVLSVDERDDLADRLFQMRCAAEDVATALGESAPRADLVELVEVLLEAARAAERIR